MSGLPKLKMTITLSIEPNTWFLYREVCAKEHIVPSHEVEAFMRQRLAELLPQPIAQSPK